ncbi:MAG: hypothetical protein ACOCTO_01890, partial [Marinilabiliaceae bacterium]
LLPKEPLPHSVQANISDNTIFGFLVDTPENEKAFHFPECFFIKIPFLHLHLPGPRAGLFDAFAHGCSDSTCK